MFGPRYSSDCASSRAPAGAAPRTSRANVTRFMTDPPGGDVRCTNVHFDSAFRTPHSTLASPPLPHPPVVQHRHDAALLEHLDPRRVAVGLAVAHVRDPRVDDQLGA